jgi:uncharacterized OsmC-like protein
MPSSPSWSPVSLRVSSPRAGESTSYARQHQLTLGRAVTFDSLDPRLSALEAFAGAVAADLMDTFRRVARERRLAVDEIEATVEVLLENPLTHLGVVGETGSPALQRLAIKAYASSFDDESALRSAWETAQQRSPLVSTLRRGAEVVANLQIAH